MRSWAVLVGVTSVGTVRDHEHVRRSKALRKHRVTLSVMDICLVDDATRFIKMERAGLQEETDQICTKRLISQLKSSIVHWSLEPVRVLGQMEYFGLVV